MQYSRGWGAARVLEGVTPQKKEGISLKNSAQKLVSFFLPLFNLEPRFGNRGLQSLGRT